MEKFNKFSIENLNTAVSIIDEFQNNNNTDLSLQNLKNLILEEIESRVNLNAVDNIEDLKNKYLGKYVGYKRCDDIIYFKIDSINYIKDIDIVSIETQLAIFEDDWLFIQYAPECTSICNLNPRNLDMRDFFYISKEEFDEKLNKVINHNK